MSFYNINFKKPSGTICLIVVTLLVFVMLALGIIYMEIADLTKSLIEEEQSNDKLFVDSSYIDLEIVEVGETYTILRDVDSDVLYFELKRNGYSSALSVIYNNDGSPKTYSQFINGG